MTYLDRLAQLEMHQRPTDKTDKSISVGFVSSLPAHIERAANETDPALSNSENGLLRDSAATARRQRVLAMLAEHPDQPRNITPAALTIAPAERSRLGDAVAPEAELNALVDAVASFHGFNPEQKAEAKQIALADLEAALDCFRDLAARIPGIQTMTDINREQ